MNAPRLSSRLRQQGMVSAMAVIFLIAVVIFALSQTLGITGSNSIDNKHQMDSVAALSLAESGLERGQGILSPATVFTDTVCKGIAGGPYSLGGSGRTFTLSATSQPDPCDSSGATICDKCVITATGKVESASRTITRTLSLTSLPGTSCNASTTNCTNSTAPPPTWKLTLKNSYPNTAIALFNLATRRQGAQTSAGCTNPQCALEWNINAQNGVNSIGDMGNAVTILSGASYDIYQTMNSNRNLAEVGALFPGSGSGPSIKGAFWGDTNPAGDPKTIGRTADSTGRTNNGTASSAACTTTPTTNSFQACTNWCYGGDTLVFGFGAHAEALTDQLNSVTFNTAGTPAQNIPLTIIAKFPDPTIPGAPTDVYSEVWYAHNPNLSPATSPVASSASSYKGNGTGAIGATFTGSVSGTTLTVTSSFGAQPFLRIISPGIAGTGDTVTSSGGAPPQVSGNPTILSQVTSTESGGALGGSGTYQISGSPQTVSSKTMIASSKTLHVTACTICFFAPGDVIQSPAYTISSQQSGIPQGGVGNYPVSGTAPNGDYVVTSFVILAGTPGTPGTTIYLPSTQSMPTVTTPNTRIAVVSPPGAFAANTTVTAVGAPNAATNSFTVSPAPTTPLNLATICGGTCAFFDHAAPTTTFTITKTANTDYWASGFMCLSGADITPVPVTKATVNASTWSEMVQ